MPLLMLITTGCVSKPKEEKPALPPKPQRVELAPIETTADIVEALNYYEHLVQEWEAWGARAEALYNLK